GISQRAHVAGQRALPHLRQLTSDGAADVVDDLRPCGAVAVELGDELAHVIDDLLEVEDLIDAALLIGRELGAGHQRPANASRSTRPSSSENGETCNTSA